MYWATAYLLHFICPYIFIAHQIELKTATVSVLLFIEFSELQLETLWKHNTFYLQIIVIFCLN